MTAVSISSPNVSPKNMVAVRPDSKNDRADGSILRVYDVQEKAPTKVKVGALLGTVTGVALAMLYTFKRKTGNIEGIKNIKNIGDYFYNLTHIKYNELDKNKKPTYELEKLISILTLGSVGGGLLGGVVTDKKENTKAKFREAIIQVVGNIFTPLLCVDGGLRLFEKYAEDKVIKTLSNKSKSIQHAPKTVVSLICLAGGLFLGNKVGNLINEKVFHVKDNRKIKMADLSPQIDDACVAVSFLASGGESAIGTAVKRIIPAALMIAGYSTGVVQECHRKHHDNNKEQISEVKEVA